MKNKLQIKSGWLAGFIASMFFVPAGYAQMAMDMNQAEPPAQQQRARQDRRFKKHTHIPSAMDQEMLTDKDVVEPAPEAESEATRYWETADHHTAIAEQPIIPASTHFSPDSARMSMHSTPAMPGMMAQPLPAIDHDHENKESDAGSTYICPMHPHIVQHEPGGSCPICGMDLVARTTPSSHPHTSTEMPKVFVSASVIQSMGVRSAKVESRVLDKKIHTQGLVTADNDRLLSIHPRTGGWIEVLHLLTEGDRVERKEVLVDFYSPWINQVQLDFIGALEEYDLTSFDPTKKIEIAAKVESLRNALRLLNVSEMDIMRIKNSRKVQNTIQLMAPQGGIITRLNVNEGSYVEPYQSMFTIVDLSQVWIMVDIYEHQAPWVRKGDSVEISVPAIPERSWQGNVDFIYPQVDRKTRTLRARITIANPDEALLLNMFVKVDITAHASTRAVLSVPREAVIMTGERESVIRSLGNGHFQPVEITTGKRAAGHVEILSGLQAGDDIVVSGQFLIDSESSLQASFLRMSE
ncbi:MAG: efflux RND transporter periplasmic adaptor subunit [Gammaproteobacteria bacterium]|nr:efflux RND transporter periplasmic adaptor subunit [Gammaproteobacteria bacterium]MBL7000655.1 efflux RND transporter periplasmic adaptor subunit [Gammaproteobacteria bacterium]